MVPSRLPKLSDRASGVLLHPTSLPGPDGSEGGDLGPEARRFVDFLAEAGQRWWQMLPVGPTGYGNSPYSAQSAFAGNPALISVDSLVEEELLAAADRRGQPREVELRTAFAAFRRRPPDPRFTAFAEETASWLDDFALYRSIKRAHGETQWTRWEPALRDRVPEAIAAARATFVDEMAYVRFQQWRFASDWRALRAYAHGRGVALIGDIPIFVAHDSADVWQHRDLFHLGADGEPSLVAGVPPDYFSATGQRWGNPIYRWKRLRADGYRWWVDRFRAMLAEFDAIRLDHFIGFSRCWAIPADEPTAVHGRWMKGPGTDFFRVVRDALGGELPLIAEDLGLVTPAVRALRDRFRLPGTKILQFAFGTDPHAPDFLPHNYRRRAVAYTGTHDNDTTVGWFHDAGSGTRTAEQTEAERRAALRYLGAADAGDIHWKMIRAVLMSVANLVIVPAQDLLGLGSEARMNRPGTERDNWCWRLPAGVLTPELSARLRELTATFGRVDESERPVASAEAAAGPPPS